MAELFSLREAYGKKLVELGALNKDLVVLDADLAKSTKTDLFAKAYPDRFFDMGIAEADMMVTAAGLASTGKKPFCSTFAIFATGRAYDQIRNSIAYPHWNVKIAPTHAGISVGEDGASHQAIEDIALMRVIPGMTVLVPSDANMTASLTEELYRLESYAYLRMPRNELPMIYEKDEKFEIGGSRVLKEGKDIMIFACGAMVSIALNTVKRFESLGISAGVTDMYSVKPLDEKTVLKYADRVKGIITCEEHSVIGGLGDAVASVVSQNNPVMLKKVGIEDTFGESGTPQELFVKYGLTEEEIINKGREIYDRV